MLTSEAAGILAGMVLFGSASLAIIAGFVTCRLLGLLWTPRTAMADLGTAIVAELGVFLALLIITWATGRLNDGVPWLVCATAVSVVLRHLDRWKVRRGSAPPLA